MATSAIQSMTGALNGMIGGTNRQVFGVNLPNTQGCRGGKLIPIEECIVNGTNTCTGGIKFIVSNSEDVCVDTQGHRWETEIASMAAGSSG